MSHRVCNMCLYISLSLVNWNLFVNNSNLRIPVSQICVWVASIWLVAQKFAYFNHHKWSFFLFCFLNGCAPIASKQIERILITRYWRCTLDSSVCICFERIILHTEWFTLFCSCDCKLKMCELIGCLWNSIQCLFVFSGFIKKD